MKNVTKKEETLIEREARQDMERQVDLKTYTVKIEYTSRDTSQKFVIYPVPASKRNMYSNVEVRRYKFVDESEWTPWEVSAAGINTNEKGTRAETKLKVELLNTAIKVMEDADARLA